MKKFLLKLDQSLYEQLVRKAASLSLQSGKQVSISELIRSILTDAVKGK